MMEWISVEDRLPEDGEWVLMFCVEFSGVDKYRAGFYHGDNDGLSWLSAANAFGFPTVTHWMPLPDPPLTPPEK